MSNTHGAFVWYELMTAEPKAAESFYCSILGWNVRGAGVAGVDYRLMMIGDVPAAGVMAIPERATGAAPGWTGYIAVDDVDAKAKEIAHSGGSMCHEPEDIPGVGRFAVLRDPQGTVLALFKPVAARQLDPLPPRTPGTVGWHELLAQNGAGAFDFYAKHFDWTRGVGFDMGPMGVYQLFHHNNEMSGGIMTKPDPEAAPFWLFYFNVASIHTAIDAVKAGGGQVLRGPHEVPGGNIIVQCLDPQGAIFALVEPR